MTRIAIFSKLQKHSLLAMLSVLCFAAIFVDDSLVPIYSETDDLFHGPEVEITHNKQEPEPELIAPIEVVTKRIKPQKKVFKPAKPQVVELAPLPPTAEKEDLVVQEKITEVATAKIENYDSSSSIELIPKKTKKHDSTWDISYDARAIYSSYDRQYTDGDTVDDSDLLIRMRADAIATISDNFRAGIGIAGTCALSKCNVDFVLQRDLPGSTGLNTGQVTIDEMYLHWLSDDPHRFKIAIGRMQTRSVLKTGVFNKSLDRINSNNARINWTDGVHAAYQLENGWASNFIMQYNSSEGSGNVYHDAIDFTDRDSSRSYFASFENNQEVLGITQRSIGISYLPSALLSSQETDLDVTQDHEDYLGLVGKVAWSWPQKDNRFTLRGGFELGYTPTIPDNSVVNIVDDKSVSGLAWNAVINIMDIYPGHNFGINYAHTGAGWQLSPQYTPNTKLLEFRYQWQLKSRTLFEARVRWLDELEETKVLDDNPLLDQQVDFYLRFTRSF